MAILAITMPIRVITMAISAITIPIRAITMRRSGRSRSADLRDHDGAIFAEMGVGERRAGAGVGTRVRGRARG